ncbi:MAG: helix-turn-helix transcriptional regulator [Bacteroidales bacterium]|nr:helix-turn-helix transcriptional regulator [Bacteroidales bacterium]
MKILTIGKQIRKRRKELKMSVDELARRIGKDRSTVYRYENGGIGSMPLELFLPMTEALEITPQELLATIIASSEWFAAQAGRWLETTEGYEFSDEELKLFCEIAKYLMRIRNGEDYEEKINCLFILFKQLNK